MIPLKKILKKICRRDSWLVLALAILSARAGAQTTESASPPQRWLLIFDTSSGMEKRLPAVKSELENIFFSNVGGQLQAGDSVGVWTFNKKLHTGEFPLLAWNPALAANVASNLNDFLTRQTYTGNTTFATFEPSLGRIIDNSERLTILIFCDGEDDLKLTPYDAGINQTFKQAAAERKKSRRPFVLAIRTQLGQFVGATVNFPPGNLNIPAYPPLPAPLAPPVVVQPVVVPPPAPLIISGPPLVIVGTNVGTNLDEIKKNMPPPAPLTNASAASKTEVVETVPPAIISAQTNNIVETASTNPAITPVLAQTSPIAPPTNHLVTATVAAGNRADANSRGLIYLGVGLLVAAFVLVLFLILHKPRANRGSLISASMANGFSSAAKK